VLRICFLLLLLMGLSARAIAVELQPNIVLILADDECG
jgi:hypothetical protein